MSEATAATAVPTKSIQMLRRDQVEQRTGLSRSTIYQYMRAGKFPEPIQLTKQTVAWLETEIDGWILERVAASRPTKAINQ